MVSMLVPVCFDNPPMAIGPISSMRGPSMEKSLSLELLQTLRSVQVTKEAGLGEPRDPDGRSVDGARFATAASRSPECPRAAPCPADSKDLRSARRADPDRSHHRGLG